MDRSAPAACAVLFDIDGTLIDSGGAGGAALLSALQNEFRLPTTPSPVPLHGRTDSGILAELLTSHGLQATPENKQRLIEAYFEELPTSLRSRPGRVLPGVSELLDQLHGRADCHLGLLTGNLPTSAKMKLDHYGLSRFFKLGVYGDAAEERPGLSTAALAMVAQMAGAKLAAQRVVVIGDTPLDIQLATAMRVRSLAVATGGFSCQELVRAGASWVVQDLSSTGEIVDWLLSDRPASSKVKAP